MGGGRGGTLKSGSEAIVVCAPADKPCRRIHRKMRREHPGFQRTVRRRAVVSVSGIPDPDNTSQTLKEIRHLQLQLQLPAELILGAPSGRGSRRECFSVRRRQLRHTFGPFLDVPRAFPFFLFFFPPRALPSRAGGRQEMCSTSRACPSMRLGACNPMHTGSKPLG